MTALADLPTIVLGPLAGRLDADWQRAPAGKWTPAQIVEHLAIGLTWSAEKFEQRRAHAPMVRRPRSVLQQLASFVMLGLQWYPQGFKAPEGSRPGEGVTRGAAEAHFRTGFAKWEELQRLLLPARRADLFVKHPRLGDLTMQEWIRFHVVHARHHARQIRERLSA
ncbi:MAG: DUF1569 domain-containing protein [Candidatus Rokuibacteriota bacterium]